MNFNINDPVIDIETGATGVVTSISHTKDYPISVSFGDECDIYTDDGRASLCSNIVVLKKYHKK